MNLALGGKDMKIGGSMDNTPSLLHDEAVFKADPSKSAHKVAAIDMSTVSRNIVKALKNTMNYEAFWCKVGRDGPASLNTLLGLRCDACSETMIALNLFNQQQNRKTFPKKNLLEHWLKENNVNHELTLHRKKGQSREPCVRLGNNSNACSLNKKMSDNKSPPKINLPKNLEAAMMRAQKEVVAYSRADDAVGNNDEIEKNDDAAIVDDNLFIENDESINMNDNDVE